MMQKIRIGLLGTGAIVKQHMYAYYTVPIYFPELKIDIEIAAIYSRTKEKAENFAQVYRINHYYTEYEKLIKNENIDIIDISLPNRLHYEPAILAAEMGKHIICEKPLSIDHKSAFEMYKAAEKARIKHAIVYNYRWLPAIILTRKLIDEGFIGKIYHFRGMYLEDFAIDPNSPLAWRYIKSEAGSGALGDDGTHIIDLARFLVGEIKRVCGISKTHINERPLINSHEKGKVETEDEFMALLEFENNAVGTIEASRVCAGRKNFLYIEINGSEGSIAWNLERLNELKICTTKDPSEKQAFKTILITNEKHPYIERFWPPNGPIAMVDGFAIGFGEFFRSLIEDSSYVPNFYDGTINCAVIDAMLLSAIEKKWMDVSI
ncbi:MAG: Gfo/Idh/MocA family oxidoreductase [Candidatus Aenigmatarchaeota archaeon]